MLIATNYLELTIPDQYSRPILECAEPESVYVVGNKELWEQERVLWHGRTCFLQDRGHDWKWHEGRFQWCGMRGPCVVILVYETFEQKFCTFCGLKEQDERCEHK